MLWQHFKNVYAVWVWNNFGEMAQRDRPILFWPALLGRLLWSFWF